MSRKPDMIPLDETDRLKVNAMAKELNAVTGVNKPLMLNVVVAAHLLCIANAIRAAAPVTAQRLRFARQVHNALKFLIKLPEQAKTEETADVET